MIINATDETNMAELFEQARAHGNNRPVVMSFETGPRPEGVYTQLSGQPWKRKGEAIGNGVRMLAHTDEEAVTALRSHGGLGGRLVANLLESPPQGTVAWYLDFSADKITAIQFSNEDSRVLGSTCYDQLPECKLCECCAHKTGPIAFVVPVDDGIELNLRVKPREVSQAITLAKVTATHRMPTYIQRTIERTDYLEFPVGDSELVTILGDFYMESPGVVAEVLLALGREDHPGGEWLRHALQSAPGLRELAEKVDGLVGSVGE